MHPNIFILSGNIQTGKTTALLAWCKGRQDVHGILTPVINGKRMFMNILNNEMFEMEASATELDVLKIGRYIFSATAFSKATSILLSVKKKYLVIDEVGPLELMNKGLYDAVLAILQDAVHENIILVVRDGLVEKVIEHFNLPQPTLITKTALALL